MSSHVLSEPRAKRSNVSKTFDRGRNRWSLRLRVLLPHRVARALSETLDAAEQAAEGAADGSEQLVAPSCPTSTLRLRAISHVGEQVRAAGHLREHIVVNP